MTKTFKTIYIHKLMTLTVTVYIIYLICYINFFTGDNITKTVYPIKYLCFKAHIALTIVLPYFLIVNICKFITITLPLHSKGIYYQQTLLFIILFMKELIGKWEIKKERKYVYQ